MTSFVNIEWINVIIPKRDCGPSLYFQCFIFTALFSVLWENLWKKRKTTQAFLGRIWTHHHLLEGPVCLISISEISWPALNFTDVCCEVHTIRVQCPANFSEPEEYTRFYIVYMFWSCGKIIKQYTEKLWLVHGKVYPSHPA